MPIHASKYRAVFLLAAGLAAQVFAQKNDLRFDAALAAAPPALSKATLQMLPKPVSAGNAVLRTRFADKRAKTAVVIESGLGPTLLRDDGQYPDTRPGDGEYAAVVNVNAEALAAERARRIAAAPKVKEVPVFEGRELKRWLPFVPPRKFDLSPEVVNDIDVFLGLGLFVDPERELLVRHPLVVDDPTRTFNACNGTGTPMGAWTFGRLMTEIANQPVTGIDPAAFTERWFGEWLSDQTINGTVVPNRATKALRFLNQWPRLADGRLDLSRAPFRLLAIVNRQDLGTSTLYGSSGGGEARLVFGALDCQHDFFTPEEMQLTVIFEYDTQQRSCFAVRDWAQQWTALGTLAIGTAAYNAALQAITDQFTLANLKPAQAPNRSAIKQVRTNDFAFEFEWELRESRLGGNALWPGWLENTTVVQTPVPSVGGGMSTRLRDFVNTNQAAILAGTHTVPAELPAGDPFLGAQAVAGVVGHLWHSAGIVDLEARHKFSLATCDGCHTRETEAGFTHIRPRANGAQAQLSKFMTGAGMPISDPISGVSRTFNELWARRMKLDVAANMSCRLKADFAVEELFLPHLPPAFTH